MERISFRISPYALYDIVWALSRQSDKDFAYEVVVTKEDGELVVICTKRTIEHGHECECQGSVPKGAMPY